MFIDISLEDIIIGKPLFIITMRKIKYLGTYLKGNLGDYVRKTFLRDRKA